jgi:hypothetical protein
MSMVLVNQVDGAIGKGGFQWSPHMAALKRRRGGRAKPKIDFDELLGETDDPDIDIFGKVGAAKLKASDGADEKGERRNKRRDSAKAAARAANTKVTKKKSANEAAGVATTKALKKLSAETAAMFAKLNDPTVPLKERLEIEVILLKDPETKGIVRNMRYAGARKSVLKKVEGEHKEQEEQLNKNLKEEVIRQAQEDEEKRLRLEGIRETKLALKQNMRDIQKSMVYSLAKDLENIRIQAEQTNKAVAENIKRKKKEEEEREEIKKIVLSTEKNHVLRTLKEARLDQREIKSRLDD